ncbi:hypothetical protein E2C04_04805 [Nocardioides daphniae]|uniref:Phage major capsid protein n=1 Tax=Nocardioides daphniae TaxID=402297 RepID=A0A4P7UAT7_9ACTN|nr:hypothetical protein E2C04_04805 [Nocardioides daphniae]
MKVLADGTDINSIWDEFISTLDLANQKRSALVDLFTFQTTAKGETVLQTPGGTSDFEEASEYGVPKGARLEAGMLPMGYTFKWYDLATRFTWKYLADASANQVAAVHNGALEADNRLTFKAIMNRLFSNVNGVNEDGTTVYSLWNGTDGKAPPEHNGSTFPSTHSHYLTTGTAALAPADVEVLVDTVKHHGYGDGDGQTLVVLANPEEADVIAGFRSGSGAKFDFIASDDAPPYLTAETLVGSRPSGQFNGLKVLGQYGYALIVSNPLIPAGYVACLATGGSNSERNPIAFREHVQTSLQGLRIVKGKTPDYPLIDSYYNRGFGVGVRHRGAAAVLQVTTNASYTAPTF